MHGEHKLLITWVHSLPVMVFRKFFSLGHVYYCDQLFLWLVVEPLHLMSLRKEFGAWFATCLLFTSARLKVSGLLLGNYEHLYRSLILGHFCIC